MALTGNGRGIMKLYDPDYIGVRRNELPTPGRSGLSSRASTMSLNIKELENRLRQKMDEKQLQMMQHEYQHYADGAQKRQQQAQQDFADVEHRRKESERESAREQIIFDRERDEIKKIKNEFQ